MKKQKTDNTIIRTQKNRENPYVMVANAPLEDLEMSWKAKGLLTYLLSRPSNWVIMVTHLMKQSTDGEFSTRAGLNELKEHRHMQHYPVYIKGVIDHWEYVTCEEQFPEHARIKSEMIDSDGNSTFNYGNRAKEKQEKKLERGNLNLGMKDKKKDAKKLDSGNLDLGNLKEGNHGLLSTNSTNTDNTEGIIRRSVPSVLNSVNNTIINNQSISQSVLVDDRKTDRQTDELEKILEILDDEYLKEKKAIDPETFESLGEYIEELYYETEFVHNKRPIDQTKIRKLLNKLTPQCIDHVCTSYADASKVKPITNPRKYLKATILNSPHDEVVTVSADVNYNVFGNGRKKN